MVILSEAIFVEPESLAVTPKADEDKSKPAGIIMHNSSRRSWRTRECRIVSCGAIQTASVSGG